jgi:hypothetical protein
MPKPAAGDREEEEPMDTSPQSSTRGGSGSGTGSDTEESCQGSPATRSPMAGDRGTAATKHGKAASKRGDTTYSPSQSLKDWSSNLSGIKRIMEGASRSSKPQQLPAQSPPPPPPLLSRKEVKVPEAIGSGTQAEEQAVEQQAKTDIVTGPAPAHGESGASSGGDGEQPSSEAEQPNIINRAADFVRKKRAEDIKQRLGRDIMAYDSIRAHNANDSKASNLLGANGTYSLFLPGMVEMGDGHMLSGGLKMALTDRRIITTSFEYNWTCLRCDNHQDRPALKLRGEAGTGPAQAIILADQNFPALLPVSSTGQCFKIVRIKNGELLALVDELENLVGNRRIPAGSIVLIFSPSHLAKVGLSAYISDHVAAITRIKNKWGKETHVGALPPLLLAGCPDATLVREIYEFTTWAENYYAGTDCHLGETLVLAKQLIRLSRDGAQTTLEPRRYRLPAKAETDDEVLWHSGGSLHGPSAAGVALPVAIRPATQTAESRLIQSLIGELRLKLALDLDTNPTYERGLGLQSSTKKSVDYLVIGSSNASKLVKALEERGFLVCLIHKPNWRVSQGAVEDLLCLLRGAIADMDPTTVVFMLLDNSSYYGRSDDGSSTAPRKEADGIYHLVGEVTLSPRETQQEHFAAIKPLLEAAGKKRCIMIMPLPRYVTAGCCLDPGHCSNRRFQDFKQHMLNSLDMMRRNFKDFLYFAGLHNIKVLDPCMDIRGLEDNEIWGEDPVHPLLLVYTRIVTGIVKMMNAMAENEHKRRRTDSLEGQDMRSNNARCGRHDLAPRGSWMSHEARGRGSTRGYRGRDSSMSTGRGGGGGGGRGERYGGSGRYY